MKRHERLGEAHTPSGTKLELIRHDVTQPLAVDSVDRVFHLASPASVPDYLSRPIDTLRVNSLGTTQIYMRLSQRTAARSWRRQAYYDFATVLLNMNDGRSRL